MPLSWNEIKSRALQFTQEWKDEVSEDAEAKSFWDDFFNVFGISRRRVASFEQQVKKIDDKQGFIDLLWKGVILIEHKSRGKDLEKAYKQAKDYFPGLTEKELPHYILISDFERFKLYDLEDNRQYEFKLSQLVDHVHLFGFIAGYQKRTYKKTTETYDDDICNVPFIGEILHSNLNISKNILDAYYGQVWQPQRREDVSKHYVGKINHYNSPYQVSYYGAYPLMIDCEMLEYKMANVNDESGYYKHYERDAVFEALKEFAKGFQYGFDNFLKEKVSSPTSLSNKEEFKVQKIMDFLSSPINKGGLSEAHWGGRNIFDEWYNDGVQAGYNYCAWYLILENHQLFEPYFNTPNKTVKHENHISNPIEEREVVLNLEDLMNLINQNDSRNYKAFLKGLAGLEKYIHKNVFEDLHTNIERINQLIRNLTNWKEQIKSVFISPIVEPEAYSSQDLNDKKQEAVNRIVSKIEGALKVLDGRLKNKDLSYKDTVSEKEIFIKEEIVSDLHIALTPKFHNSDDLFKLLKGNNLAGKLQFKLKARLLCSIFKFLHEVEVILNPENETKAWLAKYFTTTEKNKAKLLKPATIEDYFKDRQVKSPLAELNFLENY